MTLIRLPGRGDSCRLGLEWLESLLPRHMTKVLYRFTSGSIISFLSSICPRIDQNTCVVPSNSAYGAPRGDARCGLTLMTGSQHITFGDCEIDVAAFTLRRGGATCEVEPQVLELLLYLSRNPDRLLTKDDLIRHV